MNISNIKIRIIFSTIFAVLAVETTHATDTNSAAASSNPVIAQGKGFEIKRGELDDAMAGINRLAASKGQTISPADAILIEKQILSQMINNHLLLTKATDADKAAGATAAKQHMTALLENFGSVDELNKQLLAAGETPEQERSTFADRITAQTVLFRELKIDVSDDDVKKFFDDHRISAFETPEMARISHIFISTVDPVTRAALPPDQQQAQRNIVDDLIRNIRDGVDFEALAKQYSEDPGSRVNGGELPPFPRGQMAPEIDAAAFSLTNNQISGLITTSAGYQIVKVLERIPAQKTGYLVAAQKIKDLLTQQQAQKLEPAYMEGLRAAAGVEILDPNLKTTATASATSASP